MPSGEPHRSAAHSANHVAAPIEANEAVQALRNGPAGEQRAGGEDVAHGHGIGEPPARQVDRGVGDLPPCAERVRR